RLPKYVVPRIEGLEAERVAERVADPARPATLNVHCADSSGRPSAARAEMEIRCDPDARASRTRYRTDVDEVESEIFGSTSTGVSSISSTSVSRSSTIPGLTSTTTKSPPDSTTWPG